MKFIVFAFLLFVAAASTLPQPEAQNKQERIVTGQIKKIVEKIRAQIRDSGLDPLKINKEEFKYVPLPFFIEIQAFVDTLSFTGASDIVINKLNYSILLSRLQFDLSLPALRLSVGDSGINAKILGTSYDAQFKGSLVIKQLRLVGEVRPNISIISGISIKSLAINFSVGGIESDLTVVLLGTKYSEGLNVLLNDTIPNALQTHKNEINKFLETTFLAILEEILKNINKTEDSLGYNLYIYVSVDSIRLSGEVRINLGVNGISLRSISLDFSLGGISVHFYYIYVKATV